MPKIHQSSLQEVVRYLEWRLAQAQSLVEAQAKSTSPAAIRGPLIAAFSAAARAAAGEDPDDSFAIRADSTLSIASSDPEIIAPGLARTVQAMGRRDIVSVPSAAWVAEAQVDEANKENINSTEPRNIDASSGRLIRRPHTPLAAVLVERAARTPATNPEGTTSPSGTVAGSNYDLEGAPAESNNPTNEVLDVLVSIDTYGTSNNPEITTGPASEEPPPRPVVPDEESKQSSTNDDLGLMHTPEDCRIQNSSENVE